MKPSFLPRCLLLLAVATSCLPAAATLRAAEANPTAYTALRLVGKELGADSLGRIVAVGGREGVPQPFVWRITLAPKADGTGNGARELEVAGGRIVANRPARPGAAAGERTIDLKNLNLDSSGAFTTADAEARRLRVPFSALNYDLRADPAAGNRPAWTVQLLDGDHRPLGTLLLAATDGAQLRATGQLAGGGGTTGRRSAVVASTSSSSPSSTEEPPSPPPAAEARVSSRRSRTSEEPPRRQREPRREQEPVETDGGFLERAGRTLDRTPGRIERSVRRAGANVGVGIQRFFDPDARTD